MGRREKLIEKGVAASPHTQYAANIQAERQALALEGIEDLLGKLIPLPDPPPMSLFSTDGTYIVGCGFRILIETVTTEGPVSISAKLVDLLNRHWGER